MREIRLSIATLLLLACGSAHAFSLTWTFQNAYFWDETSLTGSFDYDADVGGQAGFSNVNLVTEDGPDIAGAVYTSVTELSGDWGLSALSFGQYLGVILTAPMTNSGGVIDILPVVTTEGNVISTIFGPLPIPARLLVEGSIVADAVELVEPAILGIFAVSLILIVGLRRKTITRTGA